MRVRSHTQNCRKYLFVAHSQEKSQVDFDLGFLTKSAGGVRNPPSVGEIASLWQFRFRIVSLVVAGAAGVKYMDFEGFDPKKIDRYSRQAKGLYGKTEAYKEFQQKQNSRTKERTKDLGAQVIDEYCK